MDFTTLFLLLCLVGFLLVIAVILLSDCDLTLLYADKYGQQLGMSLIIYILELGDRSVFINMLFLATLRGKVIWITGASSGIGAAIAIEACKFGAKVALSARNVENLEAVKEKCLGDIVRNMQVIYIVCCMSCIFPTAAGCYYSIKEEDVLVLPMDVTKFVILQEKFDQVLNRFGKVN
jgi:hypothetical protein